MWARWDGEVMSGNCESGKHKSGALAQGMGGGKEEVG